MPLPDEEKIILQTLNMRHDELVARDRENIREEVGDDSRASKVPTFDMTALATTGGTLQWSEVETLLRHDFARIRRDAYRIIALGLRAHRWDIEGFRASVPETAQRLLIEQVLNRGDSEAYEVLTFVRQLIPVDSQLMGLVLAAVKAGEFEKRSLTLGAICYEAVVTEFGLDFIITSYEEVSSPLPETRRAMLDAILRAIATGGPLLQKFGSRLSCLESAEIRKALR